jgi:hypothetical protein
MPRQPSDATKLRAVKRDLNAAKHLIDQLRARMQVVKACGSGMSNICFNFSQQSRFTDDERELFKRCYREWDQAKNG